MGGATLMQLMISTYQPPDVIENKATYRNVQIHFIAEYLIALLSKPKYILTSKSKKNFDVYLSHIST